MWIPLEEVKHGQTQFKLKITLPDHFLRYGLGWARHPQEPERGERKEGLEVLKTSFTWSQIIAGATPVFHALRGRIVINTRRPIHRHSGYF